jgi:tRNA (guanine37-N1)-methyltransferase
VRISVVTVFPGFFDSSIVGITARAIEAGLLQIDVHDPREHGKGAHRQVDDTPFGGGPGMVMMPEPLARTLDPLSASHRVFLTPAGDRLTQGHLDRWAELDHLTLVCGRYEGIDQRIIDHFVDEETSLGDFVIAGGEAAALVVIEGVGRLLPGAVGNPLSTHTESFRQGMLEEPHFTRPAEFRGWPVPEVLLSGDHARIDAWRRQQRAERTARVRPDLGSGAG